MYRVHEVRKNCLCAVGNQIEDRQRARSAAWISMLAWESI